jgi:putative salt-induced outer membrane protein YdiY
LINQVYLSYQIAKGNSDYINLGAGYRCDWIHGRAYAFLSSSLEYKEASASKIIDKGFAHLRAIYSLDSSFAAEMFLQKEFNEFILLKDRNLVGAGFRYTCPDLFPKDADLDFNLNIGSGLMFENEELNTNPDTVENAVRSTNYIALKFKISEIVNLNAVAYYQVSVADMENYRILSDARIDFKLSKSISFFTSLNYRMNSRPPIDIKKYDLSINNGLSISF